MELYLHFPYIFMVWYLDSGTTLPLITLLNICLGYTVFKSMCTILGLFCINYCHHFKIYIIQNYSMILVHILGLCHHFCFHPSIICLNSANKQGKLYYNFEYINCPNAILFWFFITANTYLFSPFRQQLQDVSLWILYLKPW